MKYKDVSDIDKILKDVSIFLKGHVPFEGLFTVNREMYYKLVAFLKIYTLWEFIKVNKADAFISEDSNTEHSISYSSSIDNRLMSEEEKMNQMAAYTEKCEEEMESLNDFISKDELNEISEQYLLKALNLKVFEIQEDNQTVSETPDNTNEEADQRRKLTILKRQEGEVTYFSKVLVEE
ncbi:uncharacterized protein VICG_00630 [Vittaforma corneae ATCC 50505]|uniref:Uncharacterized protein n=1 Tax=Vittaforma corneae (strain ATCC 50505) TaxID=993615 RepID=L2GN29_VITCO|nr:uncharacterized protein VICG_00630 [Vittaforma corneae ATCC 50505]ELA42231.1 hypothetical protein VICG_00630 [Vittaforma corneae ATCC 50505]